MFKNFITSGKNTMSDIKQTFKFDKFDKFEGVLYVLGLVAVFAVIVIAFGLTGAAGLFILNTLFGFTLAYNFQNIVAVLVARWFIKSLNKNTFSLKFE